MIGKKKMFYVITKNNLKSKVKLYFFLNNKINKKF